MYWQQPIVYASLSDVGFRRRNNQDCCAVHLCSDPETWASHGHLLMVADGMGGHAVGELAAKIAADTVPHSFFKLNQLPVHEALKAAITTANATIYERGTQNRDFERMGTTCSVLVLSPKGALIGHVGDSRVYRVRGRRIEQLTFDHSLQWELARQGATNPEQILLGEPRNVITRSLGPEKSVKIDMEGPYPVTAGDIYVLCSDGLTTHVSDSEIGMIAQQLPPAEACRLLVHLANLRGGLDNITVVIARAGQAGVAETPVANNAFPAPPSSARWRTLAVLTAIVCAFIVACALILAHKLLPGAIVGAVALAIGLLQLWRRRSGTWRRRRGVSAEDTVLMKSYRTFGTKLDPQFLSQLAVIELELRQMAVEEGWAIEWPEHESRYRKAKAAMLERRYSEALREYAGVIDALMSGLHRYRKQLAHAAKWGKVPKSRILPSETSTPGDKND